MPRVSGSASLDEIIRAAIDPVVERARAAIAKAVAELAEERLSRERARPKRRQTQPRGRKAAASRPRRNVEMTEWTADSRARRVPTFVIEATKLDTKKKIVAQFGEGATFRRGKPLPAPMKGSDHVGVASGDVKVAGVVKAKGPSIRKASGA
jgi:hypothetical protein